MSARLAALVVLGCVAAAQGKVMNPCNETACSDSRCQWNMGAGQCEFKDKLGRECAKTDTSSQECPGYCTLTYEGTYRFCKAKPSPSCSVLPESLCEDYLCKWRPGANGSRGHCQHDSAIRTPCDEAGCTDSRCQLNNGECEFKTMTGRMCAIRLNPSPWNCPKYCSFVRNTTYNYCEAKSSPSCRILPKELCGEPYRCTWNDGQCENGRWTPCDEAGCTDSRCQLNNGTCEFKTKIGRECAKVLNPSDSSCPSFCKYLPQSFREEGYEYCRERPHLQCYNLPEHLCEDYEVYSCEWRNGSCSMTRRLSSGVIAAIVLSSLCVLAMCFAVMVCLLRYARQRTTKQVVTKQPVQMDAVASQSNYTNVYVEGTVPACGIPVDGYPQDAPCGHPVQAVAVPVKDAHPEGPSPPAC